MESNRQHRDIQCADDVRLMAKMRRFDQEYTAYGTTEWRSGVDVQYMATANLDKLYDYIEKRSIEGSYFTPIVSFRKRTPASSGMEEILQLATKYTLLGQQKKAYEAVDYFGCMRPVFEARPNNNGFEVLEQYRREIDGYFEEQSLQILSGLVYQAYLAKILSDEKLMYFLDWLGNAYRQIENIPVAGDKFNRTFYGFIFFESLDGDEVKYFFDAKKTEVKNKWYRLILQGNIVGPILQKKEYFHQFNQIKDIRLEFIDWLKSNQKKTRELLFNIKNQPGVIRKDAFDEAYNCCKASYDAVNAIKYYRNTINMI